ncbi:hypothetical protein V6N13_074247 [Hibiscus sabdariffa]
MNSWWSGGWRVTSAGDHWCCLKRAELWCAAWQAGDHGEAGKGPPGAAMVGSMGTKGTDWWCTMGQL